MGLIAKKSNESISPLPEGVHLAVCYGIWDLGTQYNEWFNRSSRKVLLSWELPEERIIVDRDGKQFELPRVVSKIYTLSLSDKAILRHDLETWRGKEFTKEELNGYDLSRILGVPCLLQIMHKERNGKIWSEITNIIPAPKGTKVKSENPLMFFSFDDSDDIPEGTPEWVVNIIRKAKEWETYNDPNPVIDDEIPF